MKLFTGSFNDIWTVIGITLLLILALRCLCIFVYPLFCCIDKKITNSENTNDLHNIINTNEVVTSIDIHDIPLVEVSLEDDEETCRNVPIARMV